MTGPAKFLLMEQCHEETALAGNKLYVYQNAAPNPRPNEKRLWTDRNYRRLKQCHNYYSP